MPGRTVTYTFDPLGFRSQRSVLNGYLGAVLDAQPTNYWRLGETTGTTAVDRIAAQNGTYTGGVVLNQTGAITSDTDPAVDLDGTNDWITTPLTLSTNRLKRFAIEAWVRPEATPTPPSGSYTIAGINGSIKLSLLSSRAIRLSYVDAGAVTRTLDSTTTLPLNAYRHVVAQYTGSQALIYIDGLLRGSATLPAPAGNANTFSIGNTSAATNWFNGKLDELALYPHPLTPGEVYTHKTRGTAAAATTTVRYRLGGLEETDTAGTIIRKDINAPDGTDILSDTLDPVSLSDSTNWLYYNGHGDLAAETSTSTTSTATPTTTHTYDPYGTPLDSTTSNASDVSANGTNERYTSSWDKKLDISTNLIEMGTRPYDPQLGRFLTTDPILGGSLNTYDYAGQDPINGYDLDGGQAINPAHPGLLLGIGLAVLGGACTSNPACNSGNIIAVKRLADIFRQAQGQSDDTKVQDILPHIEGSAKRQIDSRIRSNPDITLRDVRNAARTGRLPGGASIPKAAAGKAKKILTDKRFRKGV